MIMGAAEQAVTAIIYTLDGDAETLACTTYVVAETRAPADPGGADDVGTDGGAAAPPISVIEPVAFCHHLQSVFVLSHCA